jgi:hypothetical protein
MPRIVSPWKVAVKGAPNTPYGVSTCPGSPFLSFE